MNYAHSENEQGRMHLLTDHLQAVAEMAGEFAAPFQGNIPAYYAGLWHDLGKFNPEFQAYLKGTRNQGPDHKAAGALLAKKHGYIIGLLIQGHHGGLPALKNFRGWLDEKSRDPAVAQSLQDAGQVLPDLQADTIPLPPFARTDRLAAELWLRMLFSALVDADFLDTERHFKPDQTASRAPLHDLNVLHERFQQKHQRLSPEAPGNVNAARAEIYADCRAAAGSPPGIFRLTVPTGAGKTRSALAFALRHADLHRMRRVVTAVPLISITQQTAEVYRDFLESSADESSPAVLEHHSMTAATEPEEFSRNAVWSRLAAENWDAPIIVTTTVQLFESLFSNKTSATRKLHNLAGSVIILDEAQSLPPNLLGPILDVLQQLTANYGVSVVLSTATQPAFETINLFKDLKAVELVPDYPKHFQNLKRVTCEWRTEPPLSWAEAANLMRPHPQALAVLNTKKDALTLLEALDDEEAFHLSTLLCGYHRGQVIKEIATRLRQGLPCRVISTQVIEAGVDLDFPVALRALGPLDSIIQAAGRCNREGRRPAGRMIIFQPREGSQLPQGHYRTAAGITREMTRERSLNLDDPDLAVEYFRRLFQLSDTDPAGVQSYRQDFDYPEVDRRFRMIDDTTVGAVITAYGSATERQKVLEMVKYIQEGASGGRELYRAIQPWIVQIYQSQAPALIQAGLMSEVRPGLYQWMGDYHPLTGIGRVNSVEPDRLIV